MSTAQSQKGKIYMIPTTLGETEPLQVLPLSVKQAIDNIDFYIVENEKTARRFIKKINPKKSQPSLKIFLLNKFTTDQELPTFLTPCLNGYDVGIISEAGCPGIADPGADVVALAHTKGIEIVPLVGPSSILLALMASGMNGQSFAFNGYLPIEKSARKKKLRDFERLSREYNQSQIFIETPYRNDKLLADLITQLRSDTRICVAVDITLPTEYIRTKTAEAWKKEEVDLHKRPCIFIFHAVN
ncbi:SAM-dependent methyltransferase [Robertkochia solimangrovi]|uniref:SAM-dependent methyltransferase n=1 Tax=Robertkochia solimangrovi TaxID=2213046 RepID=UPI00117DED00|nr:SAM-dependent methyltransferase [Robertkochia solimangrovi]TRZ41057.1 SAM-dependent methyltransferase [Robertkochia solimangrovi]